MLNVEEFLKTLTPAQEHDMAIVGVLYVIQQHPGLDVNRIRRMTGLCEIQFRKALKQLLNNDEVFCAIENKVNKYYPYIKENVNE